MQAVSRATKINPSLISPSSDGAVETPLYGLHTGCSTCQKQESISPDSSLQKILTIAFLVIGLSPGQRSILFHTKAARIPLPVYEGIKRFFDVLVIIPALILIVPVALFIALLIWSEDGGPVLYGQDRIGRYGRTFRFYKFRSMVINAEQLKIPLEAKNEAIGPIFKMQNDPRVTRVGRTLRKYSLDELPQFYNVLVGQMSMVGPRPHLPSEVVSYTHEQKERLTIPPGLVCLREVCGRSRLSFEEWMALDLVYVRYRNVLLDAWIVLRLLPAVVFADGAY